MKKASKNSIPTPMNPVEYWDHIHSEKNIKGLIYIQMKEANEALRSARHLGLCIRLDTLGKDILNCMSRLAENVDKPETQEQQSYQVLEYRLSQFVKEAAEALQHAGKLQEYLHGARQSNRTICELREEVRLSKLDGE